MRAAERRYGRFRAFRGSRIVGTKQGRAALEVRMQRRSSSSAPAPAAAATATTFGSRSATDDISVTVNDIRSSGG